MQILPATAATDLLTTFGDTVSANSLPILGVVGAGVAVGFVMRWFRKGTNKIKP